jgi:hypothetical protein
MKSWKKHCFVIIAVILFGLMSGHAHASTSAAFTYVETDLGGGLWEYNYTLFNTSNPGSDAGFNLYDVTIYFDPTYNLIYVLPPSGWDFLPKDPDAGEISFANVFSPNPGVPPDGTDVAPGTSLGGFIFSFDQRVGNLAFDVTFSNPTELGEPVVLKGTTASASPVPLPATMTLLGSGLACIGLLRNKLRG